MEESGGEGRRGEERGEGKSRRSRGGQVTYDWVSGCAIDGAVAVTIGPPKQDRMRV